MELAYSRLSDVILDGECCGSIARISEGGLCVSATHVFVDKGNFLGNATAFGGCALQLIASFPYHDIIFLQGAWLQCKAACSLVMDLAKGLRTILAWCSLPPSFKVLLAQLFR